MADMSLKQKLETFGIKKAISYLSKDPEKNALKVLGLVDAFDRDDHFLGSRENIRRVLEDPDSNWGKLIHNFFQNVDEKVIETIFANFIVTATLLGTKKQAKIREQYGCNVPWAVLLDPTSGCNLHCTGCWAAEYGHQLNLTYDEIDDIINQANAMGTYMFIYTGGEPLVRKADLIKLCEAHPDCIFLSFTNGTLIDDKFAEDMLRVRNFIPAISVEGFETATDARRGNGTFEKVKRAMKILRDHKLPFGVSCCYTSQNTESIVSSEFFDWMVDQGVLFAWFFTYMPVGADAPTDLMVSAEQRALVYHRIREYRKTKPLMTMDFWHDGEYVYGCIAAGRYYLHINANGDIEPCVFIHYSDSNIREKTLLEAYQSPLFMEYHKNQPFNKNMLRPCPLLDNPYRLEKVVNDAGAHSTDLVKKEDVHALCAKCEATAKRWKVMADKLWAESAIDGRHCINCESTILPQNRLDPSEIIHFSEVVEMQAKEEKEAVKKNA
jgi:MoaA/NifB/PqqE/SkfB family radical SAM enzyme